jgi:hypothetical protein
MANASLAEPLEEDELKKIIHSIGGAQVTKDDSFFTKKVEESVMRLRIREAAKMEFQTQTWREPPPTYDGSKYLEQPDEEDPWSIVDLLPNGGNALLAAQFKVGKTTLLLNLLRSFCDNQPFLGRFDVLLEPDARVGFFNYEMSEVQFRRWVRRLNIRNKERFAVADLRGYGVRLGTPESDRWTVEWLQRWNVQVWIIDPYAKAYGGDSENDNTEVARFTDAVDTIKEKAGVDIAILGAHFGRQEFESGDEHVRGATRLDDWADARWIMTRNFEGDRFFFASGRDVDVPESRLAYADSSRRMTLLEGNREGRKVESMEGRILQYVTTKARTLHGEDLQVAITGGAIENAVTGRAAAVRAALKMLVSKGSLVLVTGVHGEKWHYPHDHSEIPSKGDG